MVRVGIGIGFWVWGVRECTSRSSVTPASWDFGLIEFISIDVTMQGGQAITPRSCMQLGVITTSEYIGGEGVGRG